MGFEIKLSALGLSHIAETKTEKDFTFIIGDDTYTCPWFVANFLSPSVSHLQEVDPSVNQFVIETEDPKKQFKEFLLFGQGSSLDVTEDTLSFLVSVALELSNFELYFALLDHFCDTTSVSTFCEHFGRFGPFDCFPDRAIDYIASHFYEIPNLFLTGLPLTAVSRILTSDQLKILTEDALFEYICRHFDRHRDSLELLQFVRFEFLTGTGIGNFIAWSFNHFNELDFTLSFWKQITKRLSLNVHPDFLNDGRYRGVFKPKPGLPLDGIIAFLTAECGGNVHDKGAVVVTASNCNSGLVPKNAVDLGEANYFEAPNKPNQWLKYDFKDRRVKVTNYSIAAHTNGYFLRTWVIEGSNEGQEWTPIDSRASNTDADADHPIATFAVAESEPYRFIRLRQTGRCAHANDYLVLLGFEVFGLLIG
jgi:hypothetical protein